MWSEEHTNSERRRKSIGRRDYPQSASSTVLLRGGATTRGFSACGTRRISPSLLRLPYTVKAQRGMCVIGFIPVAYERSVCTQVETTERALQEGASNLPLACQGIASNGTDDNRRSITCAARSDRKPPSMAPNDPATRGTQEMNDSRWELGMPTLCHGELVTW